MQNPEQTDSIIDESSSLGEINKFFTKNHKCMISMRYFGEYAKNALFLGADSECKWEIVQDSQFCWCLIPKKIKQ